MRFEDKVVLVTGGASGIGLAIADAFSREGARVAIVDVSSMDEAALQARKGGRAMNSYLADVSDADQISQCYSSITTDFGAVNVLVNNAGVNMPKRIGELEHADWDRVMRTNLESVYHFCRLAWPGFREMGSGNIINIASIMGVVGGVDAPAYCASKAAIIMLTRCLAKDGAQHQIRANSICPGYIDTPILDRHLNQHKDPERARHELVESQPLGRLGLPEDIAKAAQFLASEDAGYISGVTLTIDGAVTATQID